MAIPLNINGNDYFYPVTGDVSWGPDATDWAVAVTSGMLQKAGGLFQLLDEVDFGPNFGLKTIYLKSRTADAATAGTIRLAKTDVLSFRNNANSANLDLSINGSDQLLFNGSPIGSITSVTDTATIDLTLTGTALSADIKVLSIDDTMIATAAAIAFSKLAPLTSGNVLVGSAGNVATSVAVSGDITISNTGVTSIGASKVTNTMLAGSIDLTTKVTGILPIANGGTGSSTQNFVDLSSNQTVAGDKIFSGSTILGDPGVEGTGINVNGINFESTLKVSDIDGTNFAQTILHRHSTTLEPLILGARANSDTSSHADVTPGMNVFTIYGSGYKTDNYKLFGSINVVVSALGTLSSSSAPGKLVFSTTPNGSVWPTDHLILDSDKSSVFSGTVSSTGFIGNLTGNASTVTTNANLTGPITSTGNATAVTNNAITNAMLAQMAAHTFKGNNTGSTADALDLTATQLTAELNVFGPDTGSGGVKGLVPATASGDASKFLKGDGTWSAAGGGSSGFNVTPLSANHNATSGEYSYIFHCDTSGGAFSITLPAPAVGANFYIKDATGSFGTNQLTIVRNASEQIEGIAASKILYANWGYYLVYSDGTNWFMGA